LISRFADTLGGHPYGSVARIAREHSPLGLITLDQHLANDNDQVHEIVGKQSLQFETVFPSNTIDLPLLSLLQRSCLQVAGIQDCSGEYEKGDGRS
jgi:hypothetical protein